MVILSAGVGALAGVLTTSWKSRKDLELQYDIDLRKRRIDAYAELWNLLEPLADYFEPGPVTHGAARNLGAALRAWYFRVGGLVLSSGTRPVYFNLQQALEGATGAAAEDFQTLDERPLEILQALASRLRTSSTRDVATRVGPRLGPSLAARLSGPWHRRFAPVRVTVDRRWQWVAGAPDPGLFVVVENVSDRELEITGVDAPAAGRAVSKHGEAAFRLQPGEDRELSAVVSAPVAGAIAPAVTVKVNGRRELSSRAMPPVPLQSHLIAPEQPERAAAGDPRPNPQP
jgi:hypothetical protein